jgi:hypothetical protein
MGKWIVPLDSGAQIGLITSWKEVQMVEEGVRGCRDFEIAEFEVFLIIGEEARKIWQNRW